MMKCDLCKHREYIGTTDPFRLSDYKCKYCNFEYDEELPYHKDDWNILDLDDDFEWSHLQILYRLHMKKVPCLAVDIWADNNMAVLVGCNAFPSKIASALNIHEDVIYVCGDTTMVIINLYMEKSLRGMKN